ncbi:tetratricopeptide repeat protein [Microbacterium invictum]|uniref:Tetratricopeptide repeat protein n=1 Tax=Microbacterium invictum TaxID=515415 RepID=A0ABZ0V5W8_9MICO|nr:tetratricopeptide repeat protein [Microbacterium invictum]WQB68996.1 tetratricopeptide repeat protein [Microbacterium invictum]
MSTTGRLDARLGEFWQTAGDRPGAELFGMLETILSEESAATGRALFERASLHDHLGDEAAAVPLYRAALEAGLPAAHRTPAIIQLGSSLRNVGDVSAAIALLQTVEAEDPLFPAAQAFLALALHDDDKPTPALRTALAALGPRLPSYQRAVSFYAGDLAPRDRVRVVAVGLLVRDGWVLAEEYAAGAGRPAFLRVPGGGVAFGENAAEAVRREFAEELQADVAEVELLAITENIYDAHGRRGHEIVHVFSLRSAALERLPRGARRAVADSDTTVGWYDLAGLASGDLPLYPVEALGLAQAQTGR